MRSAKNHNSLSQLGSVRVPAPLDAGASIENRQVAPELRAVHATSASVPVSAGAIRRKRLSRHPMRGFSLLELMVVLSIMVVVMAMALPIVQSSMANYQLQSAVSSVTGVIQSTRYRAISQGYPFQLVFSHAAGTYGLKSSPTNNGVFTNVAGWGPVPFGNTSTTLGADATLQFSGGGSVKATTGTMTLVLTRSGRTGTITVSNYGNVNVVYSP